MSDTFLYDSLLYEAEHCNSKLKEGKKLIPITPFVCSHVSYCVGSSVMLFVGSLDEQVEVCLM